MDGKEESYLKKFSDFATDTGIMVGEKIKIEEILGKEIMVNGYKISDSKYEGKQLLTLQIKLDDIDRVVFTSSGILIDQCNRYEDEIPFITIVEKVNNKFYSFT